VSAKFRKSSLIWQTSAELLQTSAVQSEVEVDVGEEEEEEEK
jgi:hypothetical protein